VALLHARNATLPFGRHERRIQDDRSHAAEERGDHARHHQAPRGVGHQGHRSFRCGRFDVGHDRRHLLVDGQRLERRLPSPPARQVDDQRRRVEERHEAVPERARRPPAMNQHHGHGERRAGVTGMAADISPVAGTHDVATSALRCSCLGRIQR
jgi:hypothetical protein